ncbi:hypothetical protein IFM89_036171 [Coptis chinensis]|uniref:FBD domain-containing protein n=1 Tax=Coptis chinensis TaxID=261450 RepID=A0A835LG79_9MAGN|nr:hypothetical protein IFM89_036171 [Coptis chinensis]
MLQSLRAALSEPLSTRSVLFMSGQMVAQIGLSQDSQIKETVGAFSLLKSTNFSRCLVRFVGGERKVHSFVQAINRWRFSFPASVFKALTSNKHRKEPSHVNSNLNWTREFWLWVIEGTCPVALGAARVKAIVEESYARIFFLNSVRDECSTTGIEGRLCDECSIGDVVVLLSLRRTFRLIILFGKEYKLKPIGSEMVDIASPELASIVPKLFKGLPLRSSGEHVLTLTILDLDFLPHLKTVEVRCFYGRENEVSVIMFLLKNARVLEKMTIISVSTLSADPKKQMKISKRLLMLPRASGCSVIDFS